MIVMTKDIGPTMIVGDNTGDYDGNEDDDEDYDGNKNHNDNDDDW